MGTMLRSNTCLVLAFCAWALLPSPAVSGTIERVALSLDGASCAVRSGELSAALSGLPGVRAVEMTMVPGHVLVDVEPGRLLERNLADVVLSFVADPGTCRVTVMQSCISADIRSHSAHSTGAHPVAAH